MLSSSDQLEHEHFQGESLKYIGNRSGQFPNTMPAELAARIRAYQTLPEGVEQIRTRAQLMVDTEAWLRSQNDVKMSASDYREPADNFQRMSTTTRDATTVLEHVIAQTRNIANTLGIALQSDRDNPRRHRGRGES